MAIRSGRMRHRFKLLRPELDSSGEPTRDEYGALSGNTEVIQRPWCNVMDVKSDESVASAVNGQELIKFEVRYSNAFLNPDTDMFIEFENAMYDITSVVDPYKRRDRLHILATKRR